MAPTSALPIGATRVVSEMQPLLVDPSQPGSGLYNAVLAIIAPPNPDESERYDEEILDLNIVGFIVMYAFFYYHFKLPLEAVTDSQLWKLKLDVEPPWIYRIVEWRSWRLHMVR